jgi:hypothetical protein
MEIQQTLGINEDWINFILDFREDMELVKHNINIQYFQNYTMVRYKNLSDFDF